MKIAAFLSLLIPSALVRAFRDSFEAIEFLELGPSFLF